MNILDELSAALRGRSTVPADEIVYPAGPQNDFSRDIPTPNNGGLIARDFTHSKLATDTATDTTPPPAAPAIIQVSDKPANAVIASQVVVGSQAQLILPSRPQRLLATIFNTDATNTMYIGASQAETQQFSGFPIAAGGSITMAVTCALYAQSPTATVTVAVMEYNLTT